MRKLLLLSTVVAFVCGAQAVNPTSPFYLPQKGNALLTGEAQWIRSNDTTDTDTSKSVGGMYAFSDNLAGTVKIGDTYSLESPFVSDGDATIPEIGFRYISENDNFKIATDIGYGFGTYASDKEGYDYISGKVTIGKQFGKFTLGASGDYRYTYRFDDEKLSRGQNIGVGLLAIYQVCDKGTIDVAYRHSLKDRLRGKNPTDTLDLVHKTDSVMLSTTYEFKDNAYITPYFGYIWADKKAYDFHNAKAFGIKIALEF